MGLYLYSPIYHMLYLDTLGNAVPFFSFASLISHLNLTFMQSGTNFPLWGEMVILTSCCILMYLNGIPFESQI